MINLISSDCLGGRYFQLNNSEYKNPFIWNSWLLSDFISLIENWGTVKLENITNAYISNNEYGNTKNVPALVIDNNYKVYFHHHHQDNTYTTPTKLHLDVDNIDLAYNDILAYLIEKWKLRCKRMDNENIIFVYNDKPFSTDTDIMQFINVKTSCKRILITCKHQYKQWESDSLKVYIKPEEIMNSTELAKLVINSFNI